MKTNPRCRGRRQRRRACFYTTLTVCCGIRREAGRRRSGIGTKAIKGGAWSDYFAMMMPVMDGLDATAGETVTSHIPVIRFTARTQEDQRAEGYDHGGRA